jgi:nucleoside-diphosphate-sugar epimerase
VDAVVRLTEHEDLESGIWNICASPESAISVVELARLIQELVHPGNPPQFNFVPYSNFGTYEDVRHRSGTAEKAKNLLEWYAKIDLREGLIRTIKSMRQSKPV